MYNLKNVYGVLSFNKTRINLLVIEKSNNSLHCIHFDYINIDYLNDKMCFKDKSDLQNKLQELLTKADEYIGTNIKRYIINISYLPIRTVKNVSKIFNLSPKKILDRDDYKTFTDSINFLGNDDEIIINIHPYLWNLDGKFFDCFPIERTGSELSFEYVAYISNKKIYDEYIELINNCSISSIGVVNNQIAFCGLLEGLNYSKKNLVVDVKSDYSTINFYDEHNQLIYFEKIDMGSNWLVEKIKHQFSISDETNINAMVDSLRSLELVNSTTALINIHKQEFLSIKVATVGNVISYIKIQTKKLLEVINSKIEEICNKTKFNYDMKYLNANNMARRLLSLSNNLDFEFFNNDIIGIEDKNIVNMIGSIQYIHSIQKQNSIINYSVDPFVSQMTFDQQIKKDILIKLGYLTTKWAAKLGG